MIACFSSKRGCKVIVITTDNKLIEFKTKCKGVFSLPDDTKLCFIDGKLSVDLPNGFNHYSNRILKLTSHY